MKRCASLNLLLAMALGLAGCATRAVHVAPLATDPAQFTGWSCARLEAEADRVQKRAADVAYDVDERGGNNLIALGLGLAVFWPALLAMRPQGSDGLELAQLKGRFDALSAAAKAQSCAPPSSALPPERAAALPLRVGERLVFEDRGGARVPQREWGLRLLAVRRQGLEFAQEPAPLVGSARWQQDTAGNVTEASEGAIFWPRLLRHDLPLGQVMAGEMAVVGNATLRARVRGQVVAVGPQWIAGRRFDVAVIELFGDVAHQDSNTRLDGVLVVDRPSGLLLRLDLRSAQPAFALQRRLARIEPPAP